MRIGLFTDTFLPVVDGVGRVAVAYAHTLPKLGHEVTVSAPMYNTGHRGGFPFELVDYNAFKVPTTPQYKTGTPVMDGNYIRRMDMIALDLVHSHSPFAAGREAQRIARQRSIPMVSTFHSKYYDDFLKATKSEAIAKAVITNIVSYYKKCDEVWTVSHASARVLADYGFDGPVEVLANGTEQRQTSAQAINEVDARFGLAGRPVLLFVGQINWKKNILRILEAAALYKAHSHDFRLVLAGQGPDAEAIQEKAAQLGIKDQLVMTGMIKDSRTLDALYARADLFVFPSLYDTFSLVVREAAAMDTPSVVVAGSCAAEDIQHGSNGYLCQDQAESLCQVIVQALDNTEKNRAIGKQAHQTLPVPWEDVLAQAASRYEALIKSNRDNPSARYLRYRLKQRKRSR